MASHVVNKALEEVLSYLAVFFLVTLFGKQLVSLEALVEVQRHFQGHGIEEAGGRRGFVQTGLLLSPAVLSEGQHGFKRSPRRKERARRAGSNAGYRWEDCVSPNIILPCSHTQRDSVARRPFGL